MELLNVKIENCNLTNSHALLIDTVPTFTINTLTLTQINMLQQDLISIIKASNVSIRNINATYILVADSEGISLKYINLYSHKIPV